MEPIPETAEALSQLGWFSDGPDLLSALTRLANHGKAVVPDLVGVSIAGLHEGITFTLVTTTEEVAVLDGVQYIAGGPCVHGAHNGEVQQFEVDDVLDEARWQMFAAATAAHSVRSTLTLPIVVEGRVRGTVNLYAASGRAFAGHHEALAEIFHAWAAGAVENADLSFTTRREAQAAPHRMAERAFIDIATGLVAERLGVDVDAAGERLVEAATRAGVSTSQLARGIVNSHGNPDKGTG